MDTVTIPFRAPAPIPHEKPLGFFGFLRAVTRNPIEVWGRRAYRDPYVVAHWLSTPTIILNDPAMIRHVLVDNPRNYALQPLRQRLLRPMLRDGLLTAEGELWRRTRRSLAPIFAPRNIDSFAPVMASRSARFAEGLVAHGPTTSDVATQMTLLTYDILQATLFSDDITGEPQAFARSMENFLGRMGAVDLLDILDAPAFLPRLTRFRARRAQTYFRTLIAETMERRQALIEREPAAAPQDFLTLLLRTPGLSKSEIEDNIITFIGAGHETTARALGWTLYLLAEAPDERAKVELELDTLLPELPDPLTWPDRLVHTRAAFEEAMRLYPPAPSLNRTALEEDRVGGLTIPAGASVLVLPWLVHRHEAYWSQPQSFMPDRFLPGRREAIERFQYLPFGVGPRVCIGQSFAMLEGVIALASLLRRLRFDYVGAKPPFPLQRITVQPGGGLPMRISRRIA